MECVFNNLDEYILVINSNGEIKYCNKALLKKLRYDESDIYNKDIANILHNQNEHVKKYYAIKKR
ncbi:PAS domain-containing protein [[Clostridium] dakarense]|uniref:PAS domain-containing protein n=1 Tax=Faecalimicrobium dakarense TaxID=1301100 RepID=UPI0004B08F0B|nr:PAS domain-containing protein [[Clostridium] dakarense]